MKLQHILEFVINLHHIRFDNKFHICLKTTIRDVTFCLVTREVIKGEVGGQYGKKYACFHSEKSGFCVHNSYSQEYDCEQYLSNFLGGADDPSEDLSDDEVASLMDLYPEMHNLDFESTPKVTVCPPYNPYGGIIGVTSAISTLILVLLIWQTAFNISENAMEYLIGYLKYFFTQIGQSDATCLGVVSSFPPSLYLCKKHVGFSPKDEFKKFVVCSDPDCNALYPLDECFRMVNGKPVPRRCSRRIEKYTKCTKTCDNPLLEANVMRNGGVYHVPKKVYCQNDIGTQIERILSRPGYERYCQEWRDRETNPDTYTDIYDGQLWEDVQGYGFLESDYDMALLMNFDFFQPYKNRSKSVGVIYLALLNLPRSIRYHSSNMIVAGIIPSLEHIDSKGKTRHEPKSMNNFLQPLVDELNTLWRVGKWINTYEKKEGELMRAMLLGVACDSPATRKISGFLSHSAIFGCTRCYHKFPGKVGQKLYCGYDYQNWDLRDIRTHRKHCNQIRFAKTDKKRSDLESQHGCRYSVLLELEYFDVIRQTSIDAMHLLFLGIAKSFFQLLVEEGILTEEKMAMISENLKNMHSTSHKSWLPKNIGSHWKFFNAYEWKNFTLTYSLQAFRRVIPPDYLRTWSLFVNACQLIAKPYVTKSEVEKAHELLCSYVKALQDQFGKEVIKPNHHMSLHLKESIMDFGGVYSTWLFSFERFNGFLGDYHNNNKGIEVTLMRKVLADCALASKSFEIPKDFFDSCSLPTSKRCIFKPAEMKKLSLKIIDIPTSPIDKCTQLWSKISHLSVPDTITGQHLIAKHLHRMDEDDIPLMCDMYRSIYPQYHILQSDLGTVAQRLNTINIGSERFYTDSVSDLKKCFVLAKWCNDSGQIDGDSEPRLGQIKFFLHHKAKIAGEMKTHIICVVQWFTHFHDTMETGYLSPVQVFRKKLKSGPATYMPVQRIMSKCVYSIREVNKYSDCIVVSPVPFDLYI